MLKTEIDSIPDRYVVNALVFNDKGQYLLLKRPNNHKFYPGYWGVIMEKVNENELFLEALFRGVNEEIGVSVNERNIMFFGKDIFREWDNHMYQVKTYFINIGNADIGLNREHKEYVWVDIGDDISSFDVMPDALSMINSMCNSLPKMV